MVFHLILYHIARSAVNLLGDVCLQLRAGKCLLLSARVDQVGGFHHDNSVFYGALRDVLAQSLEFADGPERRFPVILGVADGVVLYLVGCHMTHQFLVLELVQTEAVAFLGIVVIVLDIGYYALVHLKLHIFSCRYFLLVLV